MLVSCWSAKGGSGTTVVAVALAAVLGRRDERESLLVDLAGDCPTVLGVPEPDGPGVVDWLATTDAVPVEAIDRLERPVAAGVCLVHRGRNVIARVERADALLSHLTADDRAVVIDAGVIGGARDDDPVGEVRRAIATSSTHSLLVTRACFLSLRHALAVAMDPTGIVLVDEPGRALGRTDVEDVLGVPVVATVQVDPAVARAVDAGLLVSRLPSDLRRSLQHVA